MSNHQKSWLRGHNAIVEALEAGRWLPHELVLSDSLAQELSGPIIDSASVLQVPYELAPHERLTQLCGARDHQGVIALMPRFPYFDVESVIEQAESPALFLILDRLQDPFNFGAVCRSAGVFGVDGIFVAETGQADVNSQVARSSAGAINRLRIARARNLCETVNQLKASGIRTVATSPHAERHIDQLDCTVPLSVIVGNEGAGVGDDLLKQCDELVTIPQATSFESLNAAVSTGIVLYEIHRQRSVSQNITEVGGQD